MKWRPIDWSLSTRHHVYQVHKVTPYWTVHLSPYKVAIPDGSSRATVRCVRYCILSLKHTDPPNMSQYCHFLKDSDLKQRECSWQTGHICISHLFRPEPPYILSSELYTFNTFISFVQANISMDMSTIIEKQRMNVAILFISVWFVLNNPLRLYSIECLADRMWWFGKDCKEVGLVWLQPAQLPAVCIQTAYRNIQTVSHDNVLNGIFHS